MIIIAAEVVAFVGYTKPGHSILNSLGLTAPGAMSRPSQGPSHRGFPPGAIGHIAAAADRITGFPIERQRRSAPQRALGLSEPHSGNNPVEYLGADYLRDLGLDRQILGVRQFHDGDIEFGRQKTRPANISTTLLTARSTRRPYGVFLCSCSYLRIPVAFSQLRIAPTAAINASDCTNDRLIARRSDPVRLALCQTVQSINAP